MVNSKGKLWGDTWPNQVRIMWTAGWVEPLISTYQKLLTLRWVTVISFDILNESQHKNNHWITVQKLQKWCSFWIHKMQKYCGFWIQKSWKWTDIFLDPEFVEMVQFLDPETAKILPFLDSQIVKMYQQISASRNCRNCAISGSRNRRNGRYILYD